MNKKRCAVDGEKYNECIRMMSPDRSIAYTRGRSTPTDELRQNYSATANFQRSPKSQKLFESYKGGNMCSGLADANAAALLRVKKSQGNLSSLDQKPVSFPMRISATQEKMEFTECGEATESINLKRKRSADSESTLKRTKNDSQSNSKNSSAFVGRLAVTARYHTLKSHIEVSGDNTVFVPKDYHPDSLHQVFRSRAARDSDSNTAHVLKQKSSNLVSKSKFSISSRVPGYNETQVELNSGTVTSPSSPGDSANEVSDMLRNHPPTMALENEIQSNLFEKPKEDDSAWKLQTATRHVTNPYLQSVLLSPVNKKPRDISGAYVPGMDLLVDGSDIAPIELISRFSKTPVSSPEPFDDNSSRGLLLDDPSVSQLPHQIDSNVAQRPVSSAHTSTVSAQSAGLDLSQAIKARYAQLCQQRKRAEPTERQPLPALHLHLSKDGTSPLPPGWQRAPNIRRQTNPANKDGSVESGGDEVRRSDMYAYYYYHVRTRQTRWDPPVYPWDADPHDVLTGETGEDDPEAPYNWGCASKYSVTHEEIEAMYTRLRQRILERQCTELLHDVAGRPDAPQGAAEQGFSIELFTLVHNVLRTFRDARCKVGRIVNDEDLYYLTKKLAQAVILKEVQHLHQAQAASSASLFAAPPPPELTVNVQTRVTTYVRKYMESKGSFYRRRVQQPLGHLQQHSAPHLHHPHHVPFGHNTSHHHNHPDLSSRQNHLNTSIPQAGSSRTVWPNSTGPIDHLSASPKPVHNLFGFEGRQ